MVFGTQRRPRRRTRHAAVTFPLALLALFTCCCREQSQSNGQPAGGCPRAGAFAPTTIASPPGTGTSSPWNTVIPSSAKAVRNVFGVRPCRSCTSIPRPRELVGLTTSLRAAVSGDGIDWQSDASTYGRGDMHLSAYLNEGDTVIYQTGTWTVDGVEVGDGSPAVRRMAKVDNVQVVWTHNCEHGVIRGVALEFLDEDEGHGMKEDGEHRKKVAVSSPWKDVEFGPEQLVARLPVSWDVDADNGHRGEEAEGGVLLVQIPPDVLEC